MPLSYLITYTERLFLIDYPNYTSCYTDSRSVWYWSQTCNIILGSLHLELWNKSSNIFGFNKVMGGGLIMLSSGKQSKEIVSNSPVNDQRSLQMVSGSEVCSHNSNLAIDYLCAAYASVWQKGFMRNPYCWRHCMFNGETTSWIHFFIWGQKKKFAQSRFDSDHSPRKIIVSLVCDLNEYVFSYMQTEFSHTIL